MSDVHYRTCNLCEAMCGVAIEHENGQILSIKGDKNDVFSKGHICPKATALQDIYEDPDRIRQPIERTKDGWREISWNEALDKASAGIKALQSQYGNNSLGVYLGNPNVHNLGGMLTIKHILHALQTRSRFSATSIDQLPHHILAYHLFGHQLRIPVPDINRTHHMMIIGGNPVASNGSIMTVANVKQKLKDIQSRGGKVVVIDPRFTETADVASEHHFIRPGTDVFLLAAMLNEVFEHGYQKENKATALCDDLNELKTMVADITPEIAAKHTGLSAEEIRRLVREFCEAETAVCYGRMGVSVQEFGLLCQYLIMMLNILTGRLDEEGGLMFPSPAIDVAQQSGPGYVGKRKTRVRGLPDFNGEYPISALAEEMLEPGDGQIKGLVTIAGNPVLSTPNGMQLEKALKETEFMVSIDYYLNETTQHANIILPPVSALQQEHFDLSFHALAVHNTAKFSSTLFKPSASERQQWQIFIALAQRLQPQVNLSTRLLRQLTVWFGPKFLLNSLLKRSRYKNLSIKKLLKHPHGIDLGALKSQLPSVLKTKDKKIHLNIEFYKADIQRLKSKLNQLESEDSSIDSKILLIGRRHVRSNNSWLHNSRRLVKGKSRCTLMLHPDLAKAKGIEEGDTVRVTSRVGEVLIAAEITEKIMPGVVSIPHGWGHNKKNSQLGVASTVAGVSLNDLTDDQMIDKLSGNAAVNGVVVTLERVNQASAVAPEINDQVEIAH